MEVGAVNRAEVLREYLKSEFGIETIEQFEEAYKKCPKIDITPFVAPKEGSESRKEKLA
jgi:hypothetical protein